MSKQSEIPVKTDKEIIYGLQSRIDKLENDLVIKNKQLESRILEIEKKIMTLEKIVYKM